MSIKKSFSAAHYSGASFGACRPASFSCTDPVIGLSSRTDGSPQLDRWLSGLRRTQDPHLGKEGRSRSHPPTEEAHPCPGRHPKGTMCCTRRTNHPPSRGDSCPAHACTPSEDSGIRRYPRGSCSRSSPYLGGY